MSLFALPVTDADVKTIYNAITRKVLSDAAATAEAAAINNGNDTVFNYAQSLLDANISFSQVAMGMPSLMFNKTPSLATLDNITNVFLPPQVSLALARGFEPTVYAAEATGLALSNGADFAANFGALSNTDFALKVSQLTGINTTAILGWVNNWTAFYTQNPSAVPSGSSISLASKGAAFGDALGNALILHLPIQDTIENALIDIATGQYTVGVPITSLPTHTPLQGQPPSPGLTFTVNVDTLTANAAGAIFTAPPGVSIIGPSNTLNAGDSAVALGAAAGTAVLNVTEVASLLGNPALAAGVTLTGIATANILNTSAGVGGFSGNITGLTTVNMQAGTNGNVLLGLASSGLNTALTTIGVFADSNLTTWVAAAALAGATDAVTVNVQTPDSSLDLLVTGGGNNGYETATINSQGAAGSTNVFDMDVNYTSLATIVATGAANLTMDAGSTALNIANLHLFNGTAATGNLTIEFGGTGNVTADGGSGNDHFTFPATNSVITSHGNAGDDIFEFLATNGGTTTFNNLDLVDGGTGVNRLILEADQGALLGAGVGAKILNIQTIQHNTIGNASGALTVDMGQSGSANVLQLNGAYNANDVTVTNLITTKSVLFTGNNIDDLTLDATSLLGQVNLTMNKTVAGGTQLIDELHVTVGNLVNLTSLGDATTTNQINQVSDVNANVAIFGPHQLNFGFNPAATNATNANNAYDFNTGIIDATAQGTAGQLGLQIGLAEGSQTLALGVGNDLVHEWTSNAGEPDIINLGPLATGGNDNVVFHATFANGNLAINNANPNYTQLLGFNVANDLFTIDAAGVATPFAVTLQETNATAVFNPPAIFNYNIGTALVNLSASFTDAIKVDSAVGGGLTAQGLFNASMQATGSIIVAGAANDILFMAYNNDTQQAVIMVVHPDTAGPANVINSGDDVDVVAQIGMTFTDFQTFGNNGSLVFV